MGMQCGVGYAVRGKKKHKIRQGKTSQDKARQGKTSQDKARQVKTRQDKSRQGKKGCTYYLEGGLSERGRVRKTEKKRT